MYYYDIDEYFDEDNHWVQTKASKEQISSF